MADLKLERALAALPPDLRDEVADFAAFLLSRHGSGVTTTGDGHPLLGFAGAWQDEPLADEALLPPRSPGRDIDL